MTQFFEIVLIILLEIWILIETIHSFLHVQTFTGAVGCCWTVGHQMYRTKERTDLPARKECNVWIFVQTVKYRAATIRHLIVDQSINSKLTMNYWLINSHCSDKMSKYLLVSGSQIWRFFFFFLDIYYGKLSILRFWTVGWI